MRDIVHSAATDVQYSRLPKLLSDKDNVNILTSYNITHQRIQCSYRLFIRFWKVTCDNLEQVG